MAQEHSGISLSPWKDAQRLQSITVYSTRHGRHISIQGKKCILTSPKEGEEPIHLPLSQIRRIVFLGRPRCTEDIVYTCLRNSIPIDFLDIFGRPIGIASPYIVNPPYVDGALCSQRALELAREIISAKIANAWAVLQRRVTIDARHRLLIKRAKVAPSFSSLRGIEGMAARLYFGQIATLTKDFSFTGRQARPAPDPVNMLLSFGYGMLHNRLVSALQSCGINAKKGFYHQGRGAHYALASDLIEDMRFAVDKFVLRLLGLRQLQARDFKIARGGCRFAHTEAFKLFMESFESALAKSFKAPCSRVGIDKGDLVNLNTWIDSTALEYARWLQEKTPFEPLRMSA